MKRLALTAFVDVLFLVVYIFFLMPHSPAEALDDDEPPPGSVIVQVIWPAGLDVDIDLWVQAPGDVAVGYSNKGSKYFNLLRDDLGMTADVTPINAEYSYTRGMPAGEYTVNLHYFNAKANSGPVVCMVEIRMLLPNGKYAMVFSREVVLRSVGHEITVQRFTLDEDSNIVSRSLIPRMIRSARTRING